MLRTIAIAMRGCAALAGVAYLLGYPAGSTCRRKGDATGVDGGQAATSAPVGEAVLHAITKGDIRRVEAFLHASASRAFIVQSGIDGRRHDRRAPRSSEVVFPELVVERPQPDTEVQRRLPPVPAEQ